MFTLFDWRKFHQLCPSETLPTISVGKLCAQPVDKRLRALWRQRVNNIGEKIAKNIRTSDWRKFRQSY